MTESNSKNKPRIDHDYESFKDAYVNDQESGGPDDIWSAVRIDPRETILVVSGDNRGTARLFHPCTGKFMALESKQHAKQWIAWDRCVLSVEIDEPGYEPNAIQQWRSKDGSGARFFNYVPHEKDCYVRPPHWSLVCSSTVFSKQNRLRAQIMFEWIKAAFPGDWYIVMRILRHLHNKPKERLCLALILAGPGGTGKSMLMALMACAVGHSAVHSAASVQRTVGRFDAAALEGKYMVIIDDVNLDVARFEGHGLFDSLKKNITDNFLDVENKGADRSLKKRQAPNKLSLWLMGTNHINQMPRYASERRFKIIEPRSTQLPNDVTYVIRTILGLPVEEPAANKGQIDHEALCVFCYDYLRMGCYHWSTAEEDLIPIRDLKTSYSADVDDEHTHFWDALNLHFLDQKVFITIRDLASFANEYWAAFEGRLFRANREVNPLGHVIDRQSTTPTYDIFARRMKELATMHGFCLKTGKIDGKNAVGIFRPSDDQPSITKQYHFVKNGYALWLDLDAAHAAAKSTKDSVKAAAEQKLNDLLAELASLG